MPLTGVQSNFLVAISPRAAPATRRTEMKRAMRLNIEHLHPEASTPRARRRRNSGLGTRDSNGTGFPLSEFRVPSPESRSQVSEGGSPDAGLNVGGRGPASR